MLQIGMNLKEFLFGVQNSRKARVGGLGGLLDPELMARKQAYELKLKEAVAKDAKLADAKTAWDKVTASEKIRAELIWVCRNATRCSDRRPRTWLQCSGWPMDSPWPAPLGRCTRHDRCWSECGGRTRYHRGNAEVR